jgi:hypothetical protein
MTRRCRITDCTRQARPGRRICSMHKQRIALHGNPHFTQWTTADDHDVEAIIRDARPAEGLTRLERLLVARGLTHRGTPAHEIARIVGVEPRTVYRWRAEGFRQAA